jgi:hypothetical protein
VGSRGRLWRRSAFAVAALWLTAPGTTAAALRLDRPGTVRVTAVETSRARIDLGRRGPSVGDMQIMRQLVYNRRIKRQPIGHGEMICIGTGADSSNCTGTFFLPKGKIVVSGPLLFRQVFELAVVGGTGLYDNARGTLTVTSLGTKPQRDLLVFRLLV